MADEHVHAVIVRGQTTRNGSASRPWGLLTDLDVLKSASRAGELTAGEAASDEPLTVHPDDRVADVAARMLEHRVTHALVVEPRTSQPTGVISTLDVARIVGWGSP
jgi:CBS domain-containing protein